MTDKNRVEKPAWLSAALGIGIYEAEISEFVARDIKQKSILNKFRADGASLRAVPLVFDAVYHGKDDELIFPLAHQDSEKDNWFLTEKQLLSFINKMPTAFFAYSFDVIEEAKPMRLAERGRVDKPITIGGLSSAMDAVKTRDSVKHIKPRVL